LNVAVPFPNPLNDALGVWLPAAGVPFVGGKLWEENGLFCRPPNVTVFSFCASVFAPKLKEVGEFWKDGKDWFVRVGVPSLGLFFMDLILKSKLV
jgi:hypothetical protein